jgi:hypothetical protein
MAGWLMDNVIAWIAERVVAMLDGLLALLSATVFTSPDVTVFPQVRLLASRSALLVSAAFVFAVIAAGVIAMTHGTFHVRYQAKDLLPRLVFGFIASHFGVLLCGLLIELANAVTAAMISETSIGPETIRYVQTRMTAAMGDTTTGVLAVVIGLIIVLLVYMLLAAWFFRIAILIILAGIAPVALACYSLPQTQPAAQLWWRTLLACLATPLLQAISFSTGISLLLDPEHNLPILLGVTPGVPSMDTFNLFIVMCLLWLTVRIPKLMARYVTHTGGSLSIAGVVLRTVAIQSVTRRPPIRR